MKRMKNLLALVMAVVMVLALGIPAFADGESIEILDPKPSASYSVYKIFNVTSSTDPVEYKAVTTAQLALETAIKNATTGYPGLSFTDDHIVKKTATYSAADFANWLATYSALNDLLVTTKTGTELAADNNIIDVSGATAGAGYYFIKYDNAPYALTTVLEGQDITVQEKSNMPFDKDVFRYSKQADGTYSDTNFDQIGSDGVTYTSVAKSITAKDTDGSHTQSWDKESVEAGDKLHYVVYGKVPALGTDDYSYYYRVWDILSAGQEYVPDSLTVTITGATGNVLDTFAEVTDFGPELAVDQYRQNTTGTYTTEQPTWEIRFDFLTHVKNGDYTGGTDFVIEYDVIVTEDVGVIDNTAHVLYQQNDGAQHYKDAQTQNYDSKIVIDKFETGSAETKLSGAQFRLVKASAYDKTTGYSDFEGYYTFVENAATTNDTSDKKVIWVNDATTLTAANGGLVTTDQYGNAEFLGLEDGTYFLEEVAAPTGYVKLESPIMIVVNGEASLDPQLVVENQPAVTTANQLNQLTNLANVANTPGSVLPSTGGRGTTMLYMAGLGMMLAAGAFLIFRRRAEAGK